MSLSFYSLPLLSLCPREQVYFELIPTSWQFKYTRKHLGNYNIYDQFAIDAANGDLASYSEWGRLLLSVTSLHNRGKGGWWQTRLPFWDQLRLWGFQRGFMRSSPPWRGACE